VVERGEVVRARSVVAEHLQRTPLLSSRTLGARLKCELFQRTGSFKPRGALNKLASLSAAERARGVITISAGNHAQAVAFAAAAYGVDALVVMWSGASEPKIAATRGYGATVDLEAGGPAEAFLRLGELQEQTGRTLVHPFDDPVVVAGAGTVGLAQRAVRRRARARGLPRARASPRQRGRDRGRVPLPLRAGEARVRARGSGRDRRDPGRED
jgi:threonine dehydratase